MKLSVAVFFFLTAEYLSAQTIHINNYGLERERSFRADTIFVYLNQEFRIPKDSVSFVKNIIYIISTIEVDSGGVIKDISHKLKFKGIPIGKIALNSAFYCYFSGTLTEQGIYNYRIKHDYLWQEYAGGPFHREKKSENYPVKVLLPTLASPDVDRDTLFIGENFSFSVAAIGYDDISKYKYIISIKNAEGNNTEKAETVDGQYIVDLTKYLIPGNADKQLTVTALYNSRPFKYYLQSGRDTLSEWHFTLKNPALIKNYRWTSADTLVAIDNPQYSIIKLFYEDMDNDKTITVIPKGEGSIENFTSNNKEVFKFASVTKRTNVFEVRLTIDKEGIAPFTLEDGNFSFDFITELGTTRISNNPRTKIYKTH